MLVVVCYCRARCPAPPPARRIKHSGKLHAQPIFLFENAVQPFGQGIFRTVIHLPVMLIGSPRTFQCLDILVAAIPAP